MQRKYDNMLVNTPLNEKRLKVHALIETWYIPNKNFMGDDTEIETKTSSKSKNNKGK